MEIKKQQLAASDTELLQQEATAFDRQITERVANGHIPDIRRSPPCDFFYNNSWRHPDYVCIDFGEQIEIILKTLQIYLPINRPLDILEVGCGPGHVSLEIARNGHNVLGIDISNACLEVAQQCAVEDPWKQSRGKLCFEKCDFLHPQDILQKRVFDGVVFVGSLHHFREQQAVMEGIKRILKPNGLVIVHEPTRDRVTRGNAAFIHLVRLLLSQGKGYYKHLEIPEDHDVMEAEIEKIYQDMRYEDNKGDNVQSVNDNEAGFQEMTSALGASFQQKAFQERYAFFHELIGGLRFKQTKSAKLAKYFREIDAQLCRLGVLKPTEFFFVGQGLKQ